MLNVHWWRPPTGGYNLGDEITTILLSDYFKVEHQKASLTDAQLISTGSILGFAGKQKILDGITQLNVVGSGFMTPLILNQKITNKVKFYSVRGYLSKQVLLKQSKNILLGDPGLLISRVHERAPLSSERKVYGLIPHHSKMENSEFKARFSKFKSLKVIDFRTNDLKATISEMLSCDVILSEGLHGLILSDALQLPNVWINDGPLHAGGNFKFYDYFSSVGRPFTLEILRGQTLNGAVINKNIFEWKYSQLRAVQEQIITAFGKFFDDVGINYSYLN